MLQVREEFYFTKGRIIVRGKLVARGKAKKADFVLYYKPNIPIALIEAKWLELQSLCFQADRAGEKRPRRNRGRRLHTACTKAATGFACQL